MIIKNPKATAIKTGGVIGCLTIFVLVIVGISINLSDDYWPFLILGISVAVGFVSYFVARKNLIEQSYEEDRKIKSLVKKEGTNESNIKLMFRASYLGGHKKYEKKSDVTVVILPNKLLIKELSGNPTVRIDVDFDSIEDFNIATKEQLTATRFLLVGILAFALKKKERYFYIKFKDNIGFVHNPVLGEFAGIRIDDISSQLYDLMGIYKRR